MLKICKPFYLLVPEPNLITILGSRIRSFCFYSCPIKDNLALWGLFVIVCSQCDQIGHFSKFFMTIFLRKVAQIFGDSPGYFEKTSLFGKNYFLGNFIMYLGYFYSNIWSYCLEQNNKAFLPPSSASYPLSAKWSRLGANVSGILCKLGWAPPSQQQQRRR